MKITEIIWLRTIEEKCINQHHVLPHEVEEVLRSKPRYNFVEKGFRKGEHLYAAYGRTDAGRYLIIYFIFKGKGRALIISARPMNARERKVYEQE